MLSTIKAEFRKLLTVRSTYFISLIALLLIGFVGFWVFGYKHVDGVTADTILLDFLYTAIKILGTFTALIVILLVGHEYRYNTIMYTLTSSRSRSNVFLAKLTAGLVLALIVTAITLVVGTLLMYAGFSAAHLHLAPQTVNLAEFSLHSLVIVVGGTVFAYIIAILLRSLVGAIAFFFIVPSTGEQLLSLLLKGNDKYLPYTALGKFGSVTGQVDVAFGLRVVGLYALIGGFIAWWLFLRRDAN